jgi:hypothetical protein
LQAFEGEFQHAFGQRQIRTCPGCLLLRVNVMLNEPGDNEAEQLESSGLSRFFRAPLQLGAAWRELQFAKNAGRQALDRYQRIRMQRPELTGRALFEAFVCERNAIGASAAQVILQRAEASFAAWPNDRGLIFRDVVQYLVISEYLVSHPKRGGTTTNMARTISRLISEKL